MTADATLPASDDLTPEVLARWEELAANATEGPWFREYGDVVTSDTDPRDAWADEPRAEQIFQRAGHRGLREERAKADSAFAAEARTAMPALLSGVRSRDARIAEAERILLGGIGQSWSRVVDRAILALRGADHE